METERITELVDTGERMIPPTNNEISFVFARHQFAYQHARQLVEGKAVIDVGCGTGYGCKILAQKAQHVHGIDYNADAIAYCRKFYGAPNISYFQMEAASLEFAPMFDVGVSFQVIEHMVDAGGFIERMKRIVKPMGMILISTPNVRTPSAQGGKNPFHFTEMNYDQFYQLLGAKFSSFEVLGITYASRNILRHLLQTLPFYHWGKILKRKSKIKKLADGVLDLTAFKIINSNVANEAMDLLAVCQNC
jgi:2-polyprenyl-3-methyl-5-hydroxy-6-metoxy-1,4-benzoquinol methylase